MGPTLNEALETFSYHQPNSIQVACITCVREASKNWVRAIWDVVPEGPDRTAAIRKIHEAMMTCNKAIVCQKDG